MKYKRNYNNFKDSVLLIIGAVLALSEYFVFVLGFVFNRKVHLSNRIYPFVLSSVIYVGIFVACVLYLFYGGFDYWYLTDSCIYSKNLFGKTIEIKLNEIVNVQKTELKKTVTLRGKTYGYIINSENKKINIAESKKTNYDALEYELKKRNLI